MKTRRSADALKNKIAGHLVKISKERDALRLLRDEIDSVLEPTDRGIEALEEAIMALSEQC